MRLRAKAVRYEGSGAFVGLTYLARTTVASMSLVVSLASSSWSRVKVQHMKPSRLIFVTRQPLSRGSSTSATCSSCTDPVFLLHRHLLIWAGPNSQVDEIFDPGADHIRMIFLQVVNPRAELHHSAIL
jgi:hypothetical protein